MLWPGWLTAEFIAEQKALLGGRGFEAIYQQNPQPEAGLAFRREWFENTYDLLPVADRTIVVVDGAWKTGISADRSALGYWGKNAQNYWPIDIEAGRWEYHDLRRHLLDFCGRTDPNKVLIEDAASGTALISELKRDTSLPVVGVKPIVSKIARVEAVTPLFESGRVLVPKYSSWKDDWVSEHLRFPAGTHDDLVDTTAMALTDLSQQIDGYAFYGFLGDSVPAAFGSVACNEWGGPLRIAS